MKNRLVPILVLTMLLVGGAGIYVKRYPLLGAVKEWRAGTHLKAALLAREEGELEKARQLALASLSFRPNDTEALRLLMRSLDTQTAGNFLPLAKLLFIRPDATIEDRTKCLDVFLLFQEYRLFWKMFESLPETVKFEPEFRLRHALYHANQGEGRVALDVLGEVADKDHRFRRLRASILAALGNPKGRAVGQTELAGFLASPDRNISEAAFRSITEIPVGLIFCGARHSISKR